MGVISAGPGSTLAFSSASGGKIYAYNNISETTEIRVAVQNPSRQRITFHNPGPNDIFIAPQQIQNTINNFTPTSNQPLFISNAALGGSFRLFGNGGTLVIEGECQNVWSALAATGAGDANPLTVMDSNV